MSWQSITVRVPDDLVKEALVGEFASDRITGVWERPTGDGGLEVVLYFESGRTPPLARARITRVFERNARRAPEIRMGTEGPADWSLEWRRGFEAFPLGERFRVVPSWEEPPKGDVRIVLRIDPGMAFGTGTHETTRLVIEALETARFDHPVLDLGTGSGILAIAAAKLGAPRVLACDVDRDAVSVADGNFRKNGARVDLFEGSVDAVGTASMGLIMGNLAADVLEDLIGEIGRALTRDGQAVLSGVLAGQAQRLEASVTDVGLAIASRRELGEWVAWRVGKRGD